MEKINFEDGQLVKSGYVEIDGNKYPIIEAEYDGATPLSAFILNKMQENIESAIGEVSSFDPVIVESLPTEDILEKTMYLVLSEDNEEIKRYDAYVYKQNEWRGIGSLKIDPSQLTVNLVENSYKLTLTEAVAGGTITVPSSYKVGADRLDVYLNGEKLIKASTSDTEGHYYEVGTEGTLSNTIQITSDWTASVGDVFEFTIRTNGQGEGEEIPVDTLPIGSIVEYEGDTVPNGFVEVDDENNYSTEETVIGKWIDGKPLYRKVLKALDITTVQGTNRKDWDLTSLHISEIINSIGFVQFWQPSMNAYQRLDVNGWSNTQEDFHQSFEMTSAEVSMKTKVNFYLILEYTKTTD